MAKCLQCGGEVKKEPERNFAICEYCGCVYPVERVVAK